MQSNQQFSTRKPLLNPTDEAGGRTLLAPVSSIFDGGVLPPGVLPLQPFQGVQFQPSETCPRNFIIFDQTYNRSKIMFHPAVGSKFCFPGPSTGVPLCRDNTVKGCLNNEQIEATSSLKENSADIDVLLSFDEEEYDVCDEEELSTARTDENYNCNSPDSCSNYESPPKKIRVTSLRKTSGHGSSCSGRKRQKIRRMVKSLRSIVPGASRMNTVAVLDEAVKYLKSLQVEVQKLGVGNLKSYA